ncbi:MAG: TatD family hydrolase [Deltaproteobacteria bacterium]|nr:TatD family hydrolase [Deltaproteobacteria bacterium]
MPETPSGGITHAVRPEPFDNAQDRRSGAQAERSRRAPLIDTHCHIQTEEFDEDRHEVLARAREAGVDTLIVVGGAGDLSTNDAAVTLAEQHAGLYATVGMHPHDAKDVAEEDMDRLRGLTGHPKVVAIGETGLDFHYDNSPREVQREMFDRFAGLAVERRLPIVVHNRESDREVAETIRNRGGGKLEGVIHCFTSDQAAARSFLDLGFYLSFSGIVTFKNADGLRDVARWAPLDRLLIETDAPFLAPVPKRGRRNEPAYVRFVAETLAQVRGVGVDEIADAAGRNARALFGLPSGETPGKP